MVTTRSGSAAPPPTPPAPQKAPAQTLEPISSGDGPAPSGDGPVPSRDGPAPASSGDGPASSGDGPASSGDGPASTGDDPAPPRPTAVAAAVVPSSAADDPDPPRSKKTRNRDKKAVGFLAAYEADLKAAETETRLRRAAFEYLAGAFDKTASNAPKELREKLSSPLAAALHEAARQLGVVGTPPPAPATMPTTTPATTPKQAAAPTPAHGKQSAGCQPTTSPAASQGATRSFASVAASAATLPAPPGPPKRAAAPKPKKDAGKARVVYISMPSKDGTQAHPWSVSSELRRVGAEHTKVWAAESGFGVRVKGPVATFMEKAAPVLAAEGASASERKTTHAYVVKRIPRSIGPTVIDEACVAKEASEVTRMEVARASWSRHDPPDAQFRTAVVHFSEPVRHDFRLFQCSAPSRPMARTAKVHQCARCWRFHAEENCRFGQRCRLCGHGKSDHDCHGAKEPRCVNCRGPHAANHPTCPLRPKQDHSGGLLRVPNEVRSDIRQHGAQQAKAAYRRL